MTGTAPVRVTVVGYASLDSSTSVSEFRGVDATSILERALVSAEPGVGGIAHIVSAIAGTPAAVEAISWVADDLPGRRWAESVARCAGIRGVARSGTRSPAATMIEIGSGGTICLFDPGDCHPDALTDEQREIVTEGDWLLLTVAPRRITEQILDALPDSARLVWAVKHDDDAYTPEMVARILARADVVSFSRGERPYVTLDRRPPESLVRPGALVVETRGADGVAWSFASPDGAARPGSIAVEPVEAEDTTGAGDTFVGALVGFLSDAVGPHSALASLDDEEVGRLVAGASTAAGELLRRRTATGPTATGPTPTGGPVADPPATAPTAPGRPADASQPAERPAHLKEKH